MAFLHTHPGLWLPMLVAKTLVLEHQALLVRLPLSPGKGICPIINLGKCANNQNGNLRWHLPLGVRPPPPLMAQISRHFFTPLFSFAIESYIYETDFTLQKYHF